MINPDDFVISRRRKKYKFAKFANSPLCFEFEEWQKTAVDVIEVGAGSALFSVELATLHPEKQFVAIDVKADRLQKGAYEAQSRELTNIRFLRVRADQLTECFKKDSIETIWVTFPDPFPKQSSAGRRLTHPTFLHLYKELLKKSGSLCFKTDARPLFQWSLEQLIEQKWQLLELSFDLHDSNLDEEYKLTTTYETRWLSEGTPTNFLRATISK